jgi:signal transduction histidine kinase
MLEAQLLLGRKLEAIGQLAAGIAHEINTPAQYLSDNLQFLRDVFVSLFAYVDEVQAVCRNGLSPEHALRLTSAAESLDLEFARDNAPRALEEASQGIARITEIVSAMKEFSRPGSREKEPVDLNKALASSITMAQSEWKGPCEVKTELARDLPAIVCRAAEMNQVFLNLIVNAAQAIADAVGDSGAKGVISISTRRDADMVEVRIRDTGNGIPGEIRDRVFDPFFTTKEVGRGTGQGLSVARSIVVDKHGGELSFQTEPGKGTTFLVRLPIG